MKNSPHTPLRSPDMVSPKAFYKTRAPKRGETGFMSKGRRSFLDIDPNAPDKGRTVTDFSPRPVEVQELKNGGLKQVRRNNGRFTQPLVYDASLAAKLV